MTIQKSRTPRHIPIILQTVLMLTILSSNVVMGVESNDIQNTIQVELAEIESEIRNLNNSSNLNNLQESDFTQWMSEIPELTSKITLSKNKLLNLGKQIKGLKGKGVFDKIAKAYIDIVNEVNKLTVKQGNKINEIKKVNKLEEFVKIAQQPDSVVVGQLSKMRTEVTDQLEEEVRHTSPGRTKVIPPVQKKDRRQTMDDVANMVKTMIINHRKANIKMQNGSDSDSDSD